MNINQSVRCVQADLYIRRAQMSDGWFSYVIAPIFSTSINTSKSVFREKRCPVTLNFYFHFFLQL